MTSLGDAIAGDSQPKRGPKCGFLRLRASFTDPVDREQFDQLMREVEDGRRTSTSVARILDQVGIRYTANNLNRHLRRECNCPRLDEP